MNLGQKFEAGTMPDLPAHFLMDTFMNAKRATVIVDQRLLKSTAP
jgi:hypothetical protein